MQTINHNACKNHTGKGEVTVGAIGETYYSGYEGLLQRHY